MFIKHPDSEKGYVKHYLIDFGNTLGSFGIGTKAKTHLYDYNFNYGRVLAATINFGLYRPYWEDLKPTEFPSIGLFEAAAFHPQKWRPVYPNPAFQNMTDRDAFWAAKILARVPASAYPAIVSQAKYSDPNAANYMVQTLLERRLKTLAYWFERMSAVDDFQIAPVASSSSRKFSISFTDLWDLAGMSEAAEPLYSYRLQTIQGKALSDWQQTTKRVLSIDVTELEQKYDRVVVRLKRVNQQIESGQVDLVLRISQQLNLVGLRRWAVAAN